ncbi:MAG: serine hydrolase, partial [bacterium]
LSLIRAFADSIRKIWEVPGFAMSIVKDDKVIFAEGFGQRNIEKNLPATENTLFAIGSCSKAFTTMILGFLAEEGKIDWNELVKTYLPVYKLHDDFATARMTPRDLVTHNSGLPRHDLLWYGSSLTREQMFNRLQYLEPNKDFRTTYQYQNLMFMTAGYLAGQVAGTTWENLVKDRIFTPLGMANSNFSVEDSKKSDNHALPYVEKDDKIAFTPFRNIDEIGPAGSINSSVADMAQWVRFQLNKGKVGDKQLISESSFAMMHTPYTTMSSPQQYDEVSLASYGLGWVIQYYRGHKRVSHGGGIDGFTAHVGLLPRDNIGMVILTNKGGTPLPRIVSYYVTDLLLEMEPVDWNSRIKSQVDKAKESQEKQEDKKDEQRITGTKPSHKLAEFAGEYEHPGYGIINITHGNKQLSANFNSFSFPLEHWHYDVFRITEDIFASMKMTFYTNEKGDIDHLAIPLEAAVDPIIFDRKPSSEMADPKFLARFVGEYELESGTVVTVAMKGKRAITVTVPGQPTYDLEPYKETTFNLRGLTGYSLKFVSDKNDRVVEAVFLQPNGTFPAKRK